MNFKKIKDSLIELSSSYLEKELNSLLAEELIAAYDYLKVYKFLIGTNREEVAAEFYKHYQEEMEHADKLLNRMSELNYVNSITSLADLHNFTCISPTPFSRSVLDQCVYNRNSEQLAIDHYKRVILELGNTDPVTEDILRSILADEEEHRSDLQKFIDDLVV